MKSGTPVNAVGVDGYRSGWVALAWDGRTVDASGVFPNLEEVVESFPEAEAIAVDIPIGLPEVGARRADAEARAFLGKRARSVFSTPSRAVLEAASYAEALEVSRVVSGGGLSKQSYGLRSKILEVDEVARNDDRIIEVHPEVSFRAMAGEPLGFGKKSWNGVFERRALLERHGIRVPKGLAGGEAGADDVLDAAAGAWSAARYIRGEAMSLPDPPEEIGGRRVAIWY